MPGPGPLRGARYARGRATHRLQGDTGAWIQLLKPSRRRWTWASCGQIQRVPPLGLVEIGYISNCSSLADAKNSCRLPCRLLPAHRAPRRLLEEERVSEERAQDGRARLQCRYDPLVWYPVGATRHGQACVVGKEDLEKPNARDGTVHVRRHHASRANATACARRHLAHGHRLIAGPASVVPQPRLPRGCAQAPRYPTLLRG